MVWILSAVLIAGVTGGALTVFLCVPALIGLLLFERRPRRQLAVAVLLAAAVFTLGRFSSVSSRYDLALAAGCAASMDGRPAVVEGWICGFPEHRLGGVRFPLRTTLGTRRVRLLVTGTAFGLAYGDSVRVTGKFSRPQRNRDGYLISRGAGGYFRARAGGIEVVRAGAAGSAVKRWVGKRHDGVRKQIVRGLGSQAGIPLALAVGERGALSARSREVFSRLGIPHLLALSGMHLGLVAGAVVLVLRVLRIRSRLVLLLTLTAYVGLVGEIVSLYRAYVMAVLLLLAAHVERPVNPLAALGSALFIMLIVSPGLAYSVAFQLSFAATFAVLLCVERLPRPRGKRRISRLAAWAGGILAVSTCVQLFLVPVQLHYFGGVSVSTPLATALFFPLVALVLTLSGAAVGLSAVVPVIEIPLFDSVGLVVAFFERALAWASSHAPDLVVLPRPNHYLYYGGLCACWLAGKRWWVAAAGIALCAAAFLPF